MPPVHVNLTPTAYAILGLLRERSMHGYEIAQHFKPETELGQVVPAEMSTVYTFLKDLQEHGLIRGERVTVGARPPRTVFSLTAEAEPLFLDWVGRPVARIREVRLDFLIKLYFAQRLGTVQATALVDAQIAVCRDYVERQQASGRALKPASFERLVQESKFTAAESTLSWLNRIATQIAPRKRSAAGVQKQATRSRKSQSKRTR
ncbi:MAG: PadR family transcriptional regulator [Candidatus Binatia bacterium]